MRPLQPLNKSMKKIIKILILVFAAVLLAACTVKENTEENQKEETETIIENTAVPLYDPAVFDYDLIPLFHGEPYVEVNDNHPYSVKDDTFEYIRVSSLDELGRCGDAEAIIGPDTLPADERGSIGTVKPSGWHTVRYDDLIEGKYLYNRCHLIAYEISGINADEENLVTGTRYMNVTGMLPFENQIVSYVRRTGNHVYYHATPIFIDDELVCRGILLEASSIEDDDFEFCVFCYNVQPGIAIDYQTGDSEIEEEQTILRSIPSLEQDYVLNTNTKKFHYPECDSVKAMKEKNKQYTEATREELIERGYDPCAVCNP